MNIYTLNKAFERIAIIDVYASLIWNKSYYEAGDFELYIPASNDLLSILDEGNYIVRSDDDMICIIESVKIETSAENGNYIIASGRDVKSILNRRIIWQTITFDGTVENYIRKIILDNIISPIDIDRSFKDSNGNVCVELGQLVGYGDGVQEQVSYTNVGEKIKSICEANGYGVKCVLNNKKIQFNVVKGTDNGVIFSDKFDNLDTTTYTKDTRDVITCALVGGEGEGAQRVKTDAGAGESFERRELFVDASDLQTETSEDELFEIYPDGSWVDDDFIIPSFDFAFGNDIQLNQIKSLYPSGEIIIKIDCKYYRCYNIIIAHKQTIDETDIYLYDNLFYRVYLLTRGFEEINAHGLIETFEGEVVPDATFTYKIDYDLGDIVTVINAYGIKATARIINILECFDDNGRKFEITLGG